MLNKNKTGFALGLFAGFMHLVWSLLILFGWAEPLLNFIYNLHSISIPITVESFDLGKSVALIVVTAIVGYVFGYIFATIWNKVHK